jgi:hypothetical protein
VAGATTEGALSEDERVVVLARVPDDGEFAGVPPDILADEGLLLRHAALVEEPATGRSA